MNTKDFSIITAEVINNIVNKDPDKIYDAVKNAYIKHGQKQTVNPPSYFLKFPDKLKSRIIALPALITEHPRIAGIKWISSNPENISHGLKRASAVIILNDYETGYPIACLEGGIISALRTVYSAILVSNLLSKEKQRKVIGIVGSGNISEQFVNSLLTQTLDIDLIKLFDLNAEASLKLKQKIELLNSGIKVEIANELKDLVTQSELLFFSTTAAEPYITDVAWFKHNPIVLNISLRDLAPEILIGFNNIVDDISHILKENTSPHLTEEKYDTVKFINCTVPELINGYNKFTDDKPIIFSPMGMGILDLAVANYIYEEATNSNLSIKINNFFG